MNSPSNQDLAKLPHKMQVLFAIFCAKQVTYLIEDENKEVCLKAIEIAEGFVDGIYTKEQANAAAYAATHVAANTAYAAAYAATHAATYAAANAAANAAYTAAYTAYAAAYAACAAAYAANIAIYADKEKLVKEQWNYYNELLNFDKHFEEALLGESI